MKKTTCLGGEEVARRGLDAVAGVQASPLDASVGGGGHIARGAVPLTAAAGGHPGLVRLLTNIKVTGNKFADWRFFKMF